MTFCHDNFGRETANALMQVTKFLAVFGDVQINESRLGTVSFCYVEEGHLEKPSILKMCVGVPPLPLSTFDIGTA
jgi:hypothetical protein